MRDMQWVLGELRKMEKEARRVEYSFLLYSLLLRIEYIAEAVQELQDAQK